MDIDHATSGCKQKPMSLEKFREAWQRQLMADQALQLGHLKVALAIGFHFNRNRGGEAWPGVAKIANIACVGRSTVFRATRLLAERGHLHVTRTKKGRRNLPNRYMPLLTNAKAMKPPSVITVKPPSVIATAPEPYTEPLIEPPIPINISATACAVAAKEDFRERGKPLSIESQCFDLARKSYGPTAAALVVKALRTLSAQEVLEEIQNAIETGNDLGHALWRP
jgi:hypothetical protein